MLPRSGQPVARAAVGESRAARVAGWSPRGRADQQGGADRPGDRPRRHHRRPVPQQRLGEKVLAEPREEFVERVLALPLSTVERAGSGDLVTRTFRDVHTLSRSVRFAVPETMIAVVAAVCAAGALLLTGPLMMLPCLVAVPPVWLATRWYVARARGVYCTTWT